MIDASATRCSQCGLTPEPGYEVKLCAQCRTKLCSRPYPRWLVLSALILTVVVLAASARIPAELEALRKWERGVQAVRSGDAAAAAPALEELHKSYPKSVAVEGWLALAYLKSGAGAAGISHLRRLKDRPIPKDLERELDKFFAAFKKKGDT